MKKKGALAMEDSSTDDEARHRSNSKMVNSLSFQLFF